MKLSIQTIINFINCALLIIIAIVLYIGNTSPVEEKVDNNFRDSIKLDNSKLIIDLKNIDSTNEQQQKYIQNLNNDSTLVMFYKLIGK